MSLGERMDDFEWYKVEVRVSRSGLYEVWADGADEPVSVEDTLDDALEVRQALADDGISAFIVLP